MTIPVMSYYGDPKHRGIGHPGVAAYCFCRAHAQQFNPVGGCPVCVGLGWLQKERDILQYMDILRWGGNLTKAIEKDLRERMRRGETVEWSLADEKDQFAVDIVVGYDPKKGGWHIIEDDAA